MTTPCASVDSPETSPLNIKAFIFLLTHISFFFFFFLCLLFLTSTLLMFQKLKLRLYQ